MAYRYESYDTVVIGAGHAGCEAALACARLGIKTIMFTVAMDSIALIHWASSNRAVGSLCKKAFSWL